MKDQLIRNLQLELDKIRMDLRDKNNKVEELEMKQEYMKSLMVKKDTEYKLESNKMSSELDTLTKTYHDTLLLLENAREDKETLMNENDHVQAENAKLQVKVNELAEKMSTANLDKQQGDTRVQRLTARLNQHVDELDAKEEELRQVSMDKKHLEHKVDTLSTNLEECQARYSQTEYTLRNVEDRHKQLKHEYDTLIQERQTYTKTEQHDKEDIYKLKSDIDALTNELRKLQDTLENERKATQRAKDQATNYLNNQESLAIENARLKELLSDIRKLHQEVSQENLQLHQQLENLQQANLIHTNDLASTSQERSILKERLVQIENQFHSGQADLSELLNKLQISEKERALLGSSLEVQQQENATLMEIINDLHEKLTDAKSQAAVLQKHQSTSEESVKLSEQQLDVLNTRIINLQQEVETRNATITDLLYENQHLKDQQHHGMHEAQNIQSTFEEIKHELEKQTVENRNLSRDLAESKKEVLRLQSRGDVSSQDHAVLRSTNVQLLDDVKKLRKLLDEKNEEITSSQGKMNEYRFMLQRMDQNERELTRINRSLNEKLTLIKARASH